jgi:drug/metabolite transporter (DMT)-like permease
MGGDFLVLAAVLCFSFYSVMIKKVRIDLAATLAGSRPWVGNPGSDPVLYMGSIV